MPSEVGFARRSITRRALVTGLASAAAAGVFCRGWWVTTHGKRRPPLVTHTMGEWVAFDGAFVFSELKEKTAGYSIRVTEARLLSYNEYVDAYATPGSGLGAIDGLDVPAVVTLTVGLRNDDSDGMLGISGMNLVPTPRLNEYLISDSDLLVASEDKMREGGNPGTVVNIRKGTEYEIHPGYVHQGGSTIVAGQKTQEAYLNPVTDRTFRLQLSNMPVRHVIEVSL